MLQNQGWALLDLEAGASGALYNDVVVRFTRRDAAPLPPHNLTRGDMVLISRANRPRDDAREGIIADVSGRALCIALPVADAASLSGQGFRLDMYASTVTYERATTALEAFQMPITPSDPSHGLRRCAAPCASGRPRALRGTACIASEAGVPGLALPVHELT
jgi:hypothetical protein